MLSEQDKQAILNGAYGLSRDKSKMQLIFTSDKNITMFKHLFIKHGENNHTEVWLDENLQYLTNVDQNEYDIIGLWEESIEPEPFNLERALNGESIVHKENGRITRVHRESFFNSGFFVTECYGEIKLYTEGDLNKYFYMYQEPKRPTVTLTLPCPLKELNINQTFFRSTPVGIITGELYSGELHQKLALANGGCFATREEAEAWRDAMKNNSK